MGIWSWIGEHMNTIIPSLVSAYILYEFKKHKKREEEREKERAEREYLQLENTNALCSVIKELYACVLHGRTPNGELKQAFDYAQDSKHRLEEYLRKIASKK